MIELAAFTLICGTFIGMVLGVFLMCLMAMANDADDRDQLIRRGICPECGCDETMSAACPDAYSPGYYLWCPECDASLAAPLRGDADDRQEEQRYE